MKKIFAKSLLFVFLITVSVGFINSIHSESNQSVVNLIRIDGEIISPVISDYISKAINISERKEAECLIIQLDTPGGLLKSTRKIIKDIMSSEVPVIVYVSPEGARAGSAGVFITLAANIAFMAPSTNIGAAHPVSVGGSGSFGDFFKRFNEKKKGDKNQGKSLDQNIMSEKVMNDTVAWVETIAKRRSRNVETAREFVISSLSLSQDDALRRGVIDGTALNLDDLLEKIDGIEVTLDNDAVVLNTKDAKVKTIPLTIREKILLVLASPNLAYILLMLGIYGLIFEFTNPGIGFPGVAGAIFALTAFYGLHILDANFAGLALIALAVILFIMEFKIVSYGLLTIGGLIAVFIGSLLLFDSPFEFMRASLPLVVAFTLATLFVVLLLLMLVIRSHRRKVSTGEEGMIGLEGEVHVWSGQKGRVFVHGEIWNAESEKEHKKDDSVRVIKVEGNKLIVN